MSILIEGMEMPKDNELLYLRIYPDGKVTIDGDLKCKQIASAVSVPPHGRLIDADALMQTIREHDYPLTSHFNSTDNGIFTVGIQQAVAETPTILEADETKTNKKEQKMTKQELKKEIAECEAKLKAEQERLAGLRKELDKPEYGGKRWKPEWRELYYCLTSTGEISSTFFNGAYGTDVCAQGNCFKTREEAEFEAERRKVIAELSDYAENDDAVWDGNTLHYYIYYSHECNAIHYLSFCTTQIGTVCFSSIDAAHAAIEAVGEERVKKYYLRVKE